MLTIKAIANLIENRITTLNDFERAITDYCQKHPKLRKLATHLKNSEAPAPSEENLKVMVNFIGSLKEEAAGLDKIKNKLLSKRFATASDIETKKKELQSNEQKIHEKIDQEVKRNLVAQQRRGIDVNYNYSDYATFCTDVSSLHMTISSAVQRDFTDENLKNWSALTKAYDEIYSVLKKIIAEEKSHFTESPFNEERFKNTTQPTIEEAIKIIPTLLKGDDIIEMGKNAIDMLNPIEEPSKWQKLLGSKTEAPTASESLSDALDSFTVGIAQTSVQILEKEPINYGEENFTEELKGYKVAAQRSQKSITDIEQSLNQEVEPLISEIAAKLKLRRNLLEEDFVEIENSSPNALQQQLNEDNQTKLTSVHFEKIKKIVNDYIQARRSNWNALKQFHIKAALRQSFSLNNKELTQSHIGLAQNLLSDITNNQDLTRGQLIDILKDFAKQNTNLEHEIKHPGSKEEPAELLKSGEFYYMLLAIRDVVTSKEFFERHYLKLKP